MRPLRMQGTQSSIPLRIAIHVVLHQRIYSAFPNVILPEWLDVSVSRLLVITDSVPWTPYFPGCYRRALIAFSRSVMKLICNCKKFTSSVVAKRDRIFFSFQNSTLHMASRIYESDYRKLESSQDSSGLIASACAFTVCIYVRCLYSL